MDKTNAVTAYNMVRNALKDAYRELVHAGGWRAVGKRFGISGGMAFRIATQGYEPSEPAIRVRLGLPALVPAPACPVCGEVHIKHNCTHIKKVATRWRDMDPDELKTAIENREEIHG